MLYIFLSVCCSVIVSVMLKLAKRYHIDVYQAITWNYFMAVVLSWLFLKPHLSHIQSAPFVDYLFLGLLLPSLFIFLAASIKLSGIVRTDVAQRLSLLIPIVAAFIIFGEKITMVKSLGFIVGFVAIVCTIPWQSDVRVRKAGGSPWLYLLIVFAGFGVIDVLLKQIAAFKPVAYNTSLFIIFALAFIVSFIGLIYQVFTKKMKFSWPHILIGWVLGIVNFGNILFYLKAHQALANRPSVVFSGMNIGVIILSALTGFIIFKEKLSLLNKAGLGLAIIAIIIISHFK
jgi:drug/metabolite transporter (DMT)-like permease